MSIENHIRESFKEVLHSIAEEELRICQESIRKKFMERIVGGMASICNNINIEKREEEIIIKLVQSDIKKMMMER